MSSNKNSISDFVLIINYQNWHDTINCLNALLKSKNTKFNIVILDNASPNDSYSEIWKFLSKYVVKPNNNCSDSQKEIMIEEIKERNKLCFKNSSIGNIHHLKLCCNYGFGKAVNIGVKYVENQFSIDLNSKILLLNPDVKVSPNFLSAQLAIKKETFVVGSIVNFIESPESEPVYGACSVSKFSGKPKFIKFSDEKKDIEYIYGGCLLTNLKTWKLVGEFSGEYFLYWEDTDWCYRAKRLNIEIYVDKNSIVSIREGTSIGRGYVAYYYYSRNGLYYFWKYYRSNIPFLLIASLCRGFYHLLLGKFDSGKGIFIGVIDFLIGKKGEKVIG